MKAKTSFDLNIATAPLQTRIILTLISAILYALIFLPLYGLISERAIVLSIMPIFITAYCFGWKIGGIAGILSFPANIFLFLVTGAGSLSFVDRNYWLWHLFLTVVGATVGYLRDIKIALHLEQIERKSAEEKFIHAATHDNLTGLPNRTLFHDRLNQAMERYEREGKTTAILFIDIDDFKVINDGFGHHQGDSVLVSFAERLNNCIRGYDTVARLGGDDFAILLDDLPHPHVAASICERITTSMAKPFSIEEEKVVITVSIGISLYPYDGEEVTELLKNANSAMYTAKKKGENGFHFFS